MTRRADRDRATLRANLSPGDWQPMWMAGGGVIPNRRALRLAADDPKVEVRRVGLLRRPEVRLAPVKRKRGDR